MTAIKHLMTTGFVLALALGLGASTAGADDIGPAIVVVAAGPSEKWAWCSRGLRRA